MSDLKKVLTATDRASKAIIKATADLEGVVGALGICVKTNDALTTEIEFKQSELNQIADDTATAIRVANAEIALKVTENEDKVLADLLRKRKLTHMLQADVEALELALETAKEVNEETIEKTVKQAESTLHAQYGGKIKSIEADFRVAVAQKDADINALNQKVEFMQSTIDGQAETIKAEREARISIAESSSKAQGVVVNTTSK